MQSNKQLGLLGSVQTEESLRTVLPSLRPVCHGNSFLRDSISKGGFFGSLLESAFYSFRESREFVFHLISCFLLEVGLNRAWTRYQNPIRLR